MGRRGLAAALACTIGGCAADDISDGAECFLIDDCGDENVCFLAQCVDPGFSIADVSATAAPPEASGLLRQQLRQTLALDNGFQPIELLQTVIVRGAASAMDTPIPGTLTARLSEDSECETPLPERIEEYRSTVGGDEFTLLVPTGRYVLRFEPEAVDTLPPLTLLSEDPCGIVLDADQSVPVAYPESLAEVRGTLRANATVSTGVFGAAVYGERRGENGERLASTQVVTDEAGAFTLLFPPEATGPVDLFVGPSAQRRLVPEVVFEDLVVQPDGSLENQTLGTDREVDILSNLTGIDEAGEAAISVVDARVVIQGTVGKGVLSFAVDATSSQVATPVPPGSYEVVVVPRLSQPFALASASVDVPISDSPVSLDIVLGRRVTVTGTVVSAVGDPVGDARIAFRSRESPVSREFVTRTDPNGRYRMLVDPSIRDSSAEYEVTVEPSAVDGEPLLRELVRVDNDGDTIDLQLNPATFVFGRVIGPTGAVVPDTLLSFFSRELSSTGAPVFVGSAIVNATGEFALPLPTTVDDDD